MEAAHLGKYPKQLYVSDKQISKTFNKYLERPYVLGERVMVAGYKYQKADHRYDDKTPNVPPTSDKLWRSKYCRILRRDDSGEYSIMCALEWDTLEEKLKK